MIRNERGVTLVTLTLTILLLVIITSTLATNAYSNLQISKITKLENDIKALNDRVAAYYVEYDELPVYGNGYTKAKIIEMVKNVSERDGEKYYLIDLTKLDNLTLNYGQNSPDAYVINEESHVIYYLDGVAYNGEIYYTIGEKLK